MRLPVQWLHDYCRPDLDTAALAHRLSMTGTQEERHWHHGVVDPGAFVVGRVVSADPHPDADRLRVCRVDVGEPEPVQIVCGAPNVASGQAVAVARPGAVMPDGTRLGRARLRGVQSAGMILAEDELALGTDHAGIIVLDEADSPLVAGTPLEQVLPLTTDVIELEITPNRPDCLGVYGVAREVHAATGAVLDDPPWIFDAGSPEPGVAGVGVTVEAPELCRRFGMRAFEDVRVGPSPLWLKARLMACGQRPISNVVDVTNYVMLLTGQPLHAFDADRVAGGKLVVRRGREGERLRTLDGADRELDPDTVVICDEQGPSSLAGIMGGERSEVGEHTTRVLLEAATWVGSNIQRTSTRLGLRSEASARFEKGLSPEAAMEALAVATGLLAEVCGARVLAGTIDIGPPPPPAVVVSLRPDRASALLGTTVSAQRATEILRSLDFGVAGDDSDAGPGALAVTVPHFRRLDVTREADLIEEVARIDGVERLPATLPARRGAVGTLTGAQRRRRRAEDVLVGHGLSEIAGWSFSAPDLVDRLRLDAGDPRRRLVVVENPMSEQEAVLRPTLLGSLLGAARHNAARETSDLALFEVGATYRRLPDGAETRETRALAVLLCGAPASPSWRTGAGPDADFFAAKALLEAVLGGLGVSFTVEAATEPFLHPGRCARVQVGAVTVGWLGEVHPLVAGAWELERTVVAWEIDLGAVVEDAGAASVPLYSDLISYPAVRQDLAVVVGADVPAGRVIGVLRAGAGELLAGVEVFDVYRGEQIGPGRVSLALRCEFRAGDRTLTDPEVTALRERITTALADELGGTLRA